MQKIIITLESGIVQSVTVPKNFNLPVEIHDFDTDGTEDEDIFKNKDGYYQLYEPEIIEEETPDSSGYRLDEDEIIYPVAGSWELSCPRCDGLIYTFHNESELPDEVACHRCETRYKTEGQFEYV